MTTTRKALAFTFLAIFMLILVWPLSIDNAQAQGSDLTVVAVGDSLVDGFCTGPG